MFTECFTTPLGAFNTSILVPTALDLGLPKTWWDRRDSENGQSAWDRQIVCRLSRRDRLSRLSQTDGTGRRLLKHDGKNGTVKMANLPVPSVCETATDGTGCPVCRLSVTTGRRLLKHDGENGPSDGTKRAVWRDRKTTAKTWLDRLDSENGPSLCDRS